MVELYIEGEIVDLDDKVNIELTYSINDIRNPISTNRAWSKSIDIPGTPTNNILFEHIYQGNIFRGYNPTIKKRCEIRVDSIPIIEGYIQINEISLNEEDIRYSVTIYGVNLDLFDSMGDSLLSDLDLTEYDHTYSCDVVSSTWENEIRDGYYYPWMNYNSLKFNSEYLDTPVSATTYPFYPGFYVSTIINKIFTTYGFKWDSTFFSGTTFKSLFIPFTNDRESVPSTDIIVAKHKVDLYNDGGTYTGNITTLQEYDPANLYKIVGVDPYPMVYTDQGGYWTFHIWGDALVSEEDEYEFHQGSFLINSTIVGDPDKIKTKLFQIDFTNPYWYKNFHFDFTYTVPDKILKGRRIDILPVCYTAHNDKHCGYIYNIECDFSADNNIAGISQIVTSDILPTGLKQKDLFQTLLNMFNLYVEYDTLDKQLLHIEPYAQFYYQGNKNPCNWSINDWTNKVDMSSINYKLMSELSSGSYKFSYKTDTDYLSKRYKDLTTKNIGEYTRYSTSDFISSVYNIDLLPAATVIEKSNDFIFPSIYKESTNTETPDSGYTGEINTKWNWRILSQNYIDTNEFTYSGNTYTSFYTGSHITNYSGYTDTNEVSLLFDNADTKYTWDLDIPNIYEVYWGEYIDMIRNQNSRLMTVNVMLNEIDISNLRFNKIINIGDEYYILNKLTHNPLNKVSRVELLMLPSTPIIDLTYSNFRLSTDIGYFSTDFYGLVDVHNPLNGDEKYTIEYYIYDVDMNLFSKTTSTGYAPKKSDTTLSQSLSIASSGTYTIRCYVENLEGGVIFDETDTIFIYIAQPPAQPHYDSNLSNNSYRVVTDGSPEDVGSYDYLWDLSLYEDFHELYNGYDKHYVGSSFSKYCTFTGLTPDTTYYFRCYARPWLKGIGQVSDFNSYKTDDPTNPVEDLYIDNITRTGFTLHWTNIDIQPPTITLYAWGSDEIGFSGVNIFAPPYPNSPYLPAPTSQYGSQVITGLLPETTYYIIISTTKYGGTVNSEMVSATTLDADPVLTFDFEPTINSVVLEDGWNFQRPPTGEREIYWYVRWQNTTTDIGNVYFNISVNTPDGGTETFSTLTSSVTSMATGLTYRDGNAPTDVLPGYAWSQTTPWTCEMIVNGKSKGTKTISGGSISASTSVLSVGGWRFDPVDPNTIQQGDSLKVYWTINNDGYTDATNERIKLRGYYDSSLENEVFTVMEIGPTTVPIGGKEFEFNWSGIDYDIYAPSSIYLQGELYGYTFDTPVTEGYYPFAVQPCEDDVESTNINVSHDPITGNTTQGVNFRLINNSCHDLIKDDYLLRVDWFSDNGTTHYIYSNITTKYTLTAGGGYHDYQVTRLLPNTWTNNSTCLVKIEISILSGDYQTLGTDTYTYYTSTPDIQVESSSLGEDSSWDILKMNLSLKNYGVGTGTCKVYYKFKKPDGSELVSYTGNTLTITSGDTINTSETAYCATGINGSYSCEWQLKDGTTLLDSGTSTRSIYQWATIYWVPRTGNNAELMWSGYTAGRSKTLSITFNLTGVTNSYCECEENVGAVSDLYIEPSHQGVASSSSCLSPNNTDYATFTVTGIVLSGVNGSTGVYTSNLINYVPMYGCGDSDAYVKFKVSLVDITSGDTGVVQLNNYYENYCDDVTIGYEN